MENGDNSPYFNYISWKEMGDITRSVTENGSADAMAFTLKLLAIVYAVEEETLEDMKIRDILKLRNAVEKGTTDDVVRERKWLTSHIKEKYEVDRFELIDFDE